MPFPKKKGGSREGAGKPSTKGVGAQQEGLNKEEKAAYMREAKARSRNQEKPPEAR